MSTAPPAPGGASPSPGSCLYECTVMHHRLAPKVHRFSYRIFMFAVDLDELPALDRRVGGFGYNRRALYSFRDRDHLLPGPGTVKEKLTAYLQEQKVTLPSGARVLLVTLPRVAGYIFNPVSFFFCADAAGNALCALVQVGNTFGERKLYFLPGPSGPGTFALKTPKHFYVSPFIGLETHFSFKLRVPGKVLEIHIDDHEGDQRVLLTALTGQQEPLTTSRLLWFTLKYPLVTLRVIFLIHWNALLLWAKRIPWFAKSHRLDLQREVLHPHATLSGKRV